MARTRRSAAETKESILATAELLFRKKGVSSVAVADIAAELGMSPANVFKHFHTKAALVDAVVERRLHGKTARFLLPAAGMPASHRLEHFVVGLVENHLEELAQNPIIFELVMEITQTKSLAAQCFKQELTEALRSIVQAGIDEGRYNCSSASSAAELIGPLLSCVLHPLFIARDDKDTLLARARQIVAFIDVGLRNKAC